MQEKEETLLNVMDFESKSLITSFSSGISFFPFMLLLTVYFSLFPLGQHSFSHAS